MTEGWLARLRSHGPVGLVFLVGLVLAAATGRAALLAADVTAAVEAAMVGILTIVIVTRGLTFRASDHATDDRWRIAGWCFVGTLFASVLAGVVLFRAGLRGTPVPDPLTLVAIFAGIGALSGLFIGGDQVRAIAAGRELERRHTSELLEKREAERLTFLNDLLRHNVLNGMNLVLGFTAELEARLGDDEYVERIETRSQRVVELVENVQVLVRSLSGDLEVDAVDLSATTRDQLEQARRSHDAAFHADTDPGVVVATTPLVSAVVENLLTNAAIHNPAPDAEVSVRVRRSNDTGVLVVGDNGPGIPEDVVDTYFGDGDADDGFVGDGLGLYLVEELVTTHGGTIDVDAGEAGTTFTVSFPLTAEALDADDSAQSGSG